MKSHSIIVRLNPEDTGEVPVSDKLSQVSQLRFIDGQNRIGHGIGQIIDQLVSLGLSPSETAIDLAILAATVTAADTRISRIDDAQDTWTREIDLYVPVNNPKKWNENKKLIERILKFLTGDLWQITFRNRQKGLNSLTRKPVPETQQIVFDSVALFSGGLDSYVGAIDLLEEKNSPLFVSHYRDASTSGQKICADQLDQEYGNFSSRHIRANVGFDKHDMENMGTETTTRGRSFIFFALAGLVASTSSDIVPLYVPENGLISLNVPLDPLRLGAWSTRTTHPFYMARWQELFGNLGINVHLLNPYRFKTKGEMLSECKNQSFLKKNYSITISCSSVSKARWRKRQMGHCGYCVPCIIRRASICAAFKNDTTDYYKKPDVDVLQASLAEATNVRSFQMLVGRLSQKPVLAEILVHKTGSLSDYSQDDIKEYAGVFRRGLDEVGKIVNKARIKAQ